MRYRTLTYLGLVLLGAGLLAAAAGFLVSWRRAEPPRIVAARMSPNRGIHIGAPIRFVVRLACPWRRLPLRPYRLTLPDGLQALPGQTRRLAYLGFGSWEWECGVAFQPYALGTFSGARLVIPLSGAGTKHSLTVLLPKIVVSPRLKPGEETLTVAPRLPASAVPSRRRWWQWALLAVVVAGVLAGVLWLWRRKETLPIERIVPPWEDAAAALQHLEEALPLPPDEFFLRLTDIVREYLERRLGLPATEQTTEEFVRSLEHRDALPSRLQAMLRDFLNTADRIKFAKAEATQQQMIEALRSAERLVRETRPAPEDAAAAAEAGPRNGSEPGA